MPETVSDPKPGVYVHIEFGEPGSAVIKSMEITQGVNPLMLWGLAEVFRQEGGRRMMAAEQQNARRAGLAAGAGIPIPNLRS